MSYEKEFNWEYNQVIHCEFEFKQDSLTLISWKLFNGVLEIVPNRECSEEIEIMLAKWLENEYSKNALNYFQDKIDAYLEKRYGEDYEAF